MSHLSLSKHITKMYIYGTCKCHFWSTLPCNYPTSTPNYEWKLTLREFSKIKIKYIRNLNLPKHFDFTFEIKLWKDSQITTIYSLDIGSLCVDQIFSPFIRNASCSLLSFKFIVYFMWIWSWIKSNKLLNAINSSLENDELPSLYKV